MVNLTGKNFSRGKLLSLWLKMLSITTVRQLKVDEVKAGIRHPAMKWVFYRKIVLSVDDFNRNYNFAIT